MGSQTPPQPRVLMNGISFGESPRVRPETRAPRAARTQCPGCPVHGEGEVEARRSLPSRISTRLVAGS